MLNAFVYFDFLKQVPRRAVTTIPSQHRNSGFRRMFTPPLFPKRANDPLVTSPRAKTPGSMHGSIGSAGSTGYALQSREHTPGSAGSLGYGLIDERKRNDGFSIPLTISPPRSKSQNIKKDNSGAAFWSNFQPMDPAAAIDIVPSAIGKDVVGSLPSNSNSSFVRPRTVPAELPSLKKNKSLLLRTNRKRLNTPDNNNNNNNNRNNRNNRNRNTMTRNVGTADSTKTTETAGRHIYSSGSMPSTFIGRNGLDSRGSMGSSNASFRSSLNSRGSDTPPSFNTHTPPDTPPRESTFSSERRPAYTSGSMPNTFRGLDTRESQLGPPPTPPLQNDQRLPRGLSRQLLHFSYMRFPYGNVAHAASTVLQRAGKYIAVIHVRIVFISSFFFYFLLLNHSFKTNPNKITNCFKFFSLLQLTTTLLYCSVRKHQQYKRAQMIKVQSTVRAWKARQFTRDKKSTYEAALTVMQRNARVFIAKMTVLWMRHANAARAAQKIQR